LSATRPTFFRYLGVPSDELFFISGDRLYKAGQTHGVLKARRPHESMTKFGFIDSWLFAVLTVAVQLVTYSSPLPERPTKQPI
jgi:hypothetical protein